MIPVTENKYQVCFSRAYVYATFRWLYQVQKLFFYIEEKTGPLKGASELHYYSTFLNWQGDDVGYS